MRTDIQIIPAITEAHIQQVRELFREFALSLDFDLCFQDFESELANLPGAYAPPTGQLLLATVEGSVAGCVALRDLGDGVAEMKRLWVRPSFRRVGLGRRLATAIVDQARSIGYKCMRLDTIAFMTEAVELYRSMGFDEIEPYRHNPIPGALFLEMRW